MFLANFSTSGDQAVASWTHTAVSLFSPGTTLTDGDFKLFFDEALPGDEADGQGSSLSIPQFWFVVSPPSGPRVYGRLCCEQGGL